MIIKTLPGRKTTGRALLQLFEYVCDRAKTGSMRDGKTCISKQYLSGYDHGSWVDQVLANDEKKTYNNHVRRNILRHEVCSFSKKSTEYLLANRDALKSIQKEYMTRRSQAPGMAVVHYEEGKPIHIHYVFASTNVDGSSNRMNNKELRAFKLHMESFEREHFPELHKDSQIQHGKSKKKEATDPWL